MDKGCKRFVGLGVKRWKRKSQQKVLSEEEVHASKSQKGSTEEMESSIDGKFIKSDYQFNRCWLLGKKEEGI